MKRSKLKKVKKVVEEESKPSSVMEEPFMKNAMFTCHNIQDLLFFAGYEWSGKEQKKKKKRKKTQSS